MATMVHYLSHHSSNPLQLPSDDVVNATYVDQLRSLLDAEKARAAQGLPPKSSSLPSRDDQPTSEDVIYAEYDHATPRARAKTAEEILGQEALLPKTEIFGAFDRQESSEDIVNAHQSQLADDQPDDVGEEDDGVQVEIAGYPPPNEDIMFDPPSDIVSNAAEEDEWNEENTIMLRHPDDRAQVETEMRDFEVAVPRILRDYTLLDRLGEGTFSSVYKAVEKRSRPAPYAQSGRSFVALKRIYVTSSPNRISNELVILEQCRNCRNVSQLLTAFRSRDQVVVVMPYVRNQDFREIFASMSIPSTQAYFRCLFRALADIHGKGIVHRDIKPANFLFNPIDNVGTLCDFGLAQRIDIDAANHSCLHSPPSQEYPHGRLKSIKEPYRSRLMERIQDARRKSIASSDRVGIPADETRPLVKANRAGTRGFRAPEVLLKCSDQSVALDVWSAGTIMLCVLGCKFPIFLASDDVEALMELAAVFGRRTMEKCARLHNRTFATNVTSVDHDELSWATFVGRVNPYLYQNGPVRPSMPISSSSSSSVGDVLHTSSREIRALPQRSNNTLPALHPKLFHSPPSRDQSRTSPVTRLPTRHNFLVDQAVNLMSRCLHWDPTQRITAADALLHPFLLFDEDEEMDAQGKQSMDKEFNGDCEEIDGQ